MSHQSKLKYTLRFNRLEVLSYLKQKSELESEKRKELVSVNQLINEILEDYVARECTPYQAQFYQLNEQLNHLLTLEKETHHLFKELITALTFDEQE